MLSPDVWALLTPGNFVAAVIVVAMLIYALTGGADRKSTRLNSSHSQQSRMPSSA